MAERAAHITYTSHPRPSLFEIVAQESLNATLYPALRRVLQFLAESQPSVFSRCVYSCCDELYLLISGLVHCHYLKKYDASFSEYFYGLKRIAILENTTNTSLTSSQQMLSLICLVVLPYLKIKIEEQMAKYRLEIADGVILNITERRIKQASCFVQTVTHLILQGWSVFQFVNYMSGRTPYQSPALRLVGLALTYSGELEVGYSFLDTLFKHPFSWMTLSSGLLSNTLTSTLELGAFFMQFLQSWQGDGRRRDLTGLPTPPPPQYTPQAADYRGVCPLCMQRWSVPTVLTVSGYVFCFRCLIHHLQRNSYCPVTKYPASSVNLVRLFQV